MNLREAECSRDEDADSLTTAAAGSIAGVVDGSSTKEFLDIATEWHDFLADEAAMSSERTFEGRTGASRETHAA